MPLGTPTAALRLAVETYVADIERRIELLQNESPERVLAAPLRTLVRAFGADSDHPDLDLFDEATESGIGRPDFSAREGHLLLGHVELKRLGVGADPRAFRGRHDREQWENFKRLPNLLYSDGAEFGLYRSGELVELAPGRSARARLPIQPDRRGAPVVADLEIAELADVLGAFASWQPLSPRTLRDLAERLAPLVANLRRVVRDALTWEDGPISLVTHEVRDTLFPDSDDDALADAYAQTCAYSLLLARAEGATSLDANAVERALSDAHPVLARVVRVLLEPDAEREIAWAVEVVRRQVAAVDFALLGEQEGTDTWLYFYEEFLAAYDPALRNDRGVYYTPREVIAAQVALCEDVLRTRFGKQLGFADHSVTVVDPAAGTGSYPLAVVDAAAQAASTALGEGAVAAATTDLASRLHAFEILVGPYSVAHLRLTEAIRDKGGKPPSDGVRVYLTDTLASPNAEPPIISTLMPLVREQRRARRFKSETPVVVCLGNPPYDREQHEEEHTGARKGGWVRYGDPGQVEHTHPILDDWLQPLSDAGGGVHAKNLYNDYLYFWRWAIWKVFEHHPEALRDVGGIVTFISASSFLQGPAMAYMRRQLRHLCDDIYVIDLGGEGRGTRRSENVFDILVPVAITVCVRNPGEGDPTGRVHYADWSAGSREEKLARLASLSSIDELEWESAPDEDTAPFVPSSAGEWSEWPALTDVFPWRHTGVELKRTWPIAPTRLCLSARWSALASAPQAEKAALFGNADLTIDSTPPPLLLGALGHAPLASLREGDTLPDSDVVPYEFRSFDREWIIRDERIGDRIKPVLWRSWSERQLYISTLTTHPVSKGPGVSVAACSPPDRHFYRGSYGGADTMPLYRDADATVPNLPAGLLDALVAQYGVPITPEDLYAYVIGVLGTDAYTTRFQDELGRPPQRVPLTKDARLFEQAAEVGRRLAFLGSRGERYQRDGWAVPTGAARITAPIPTSVDECPTTLTYNEDTGALGIGSGIVEPVPEAVFGFQTSGYFVIQEWIKRRLADPRGRTSSDLDRIRPIAWNIEMQGELLEVIHIVEEIVHNLTPEAADVIERIIVAEVFKADELPTPTSRERDAPRSA